MAKFSLDSVAEYIAGDSSIAEEFIAEGIHDDLEMDLEGMQTQNNNRYNKHIIRQAFQKNLSQIIMAM